MNNSFLEPSKIPLKLTMKFALKGNTTRGDDSMLA